MTVMLVIIGVIVAFMIALFFGAAGPTGKPPTNLRNSVMRMATSTGSESPSGPTSQAYRAHDAIRLVPQA